MTMADARAFLQRVLPWPPLGDPNAYFNIHYPTTKLNQLGKPIWYGDACSTLDEAVKSVQYAMSRNVATGDVYVCLSSQRMAVERQVNGRSFKTAQRSQPGAVHLRALFLDLDVKPDAYPTTKDAAKALRSWLATTGMPAPSVMVKSGTGGLHVYWTLTAPLARHEWQPYADALSRMVRDNGLIADTQCTVDAARVMRVPGTFNFKTQPPGKVELLHPMGPDYDIAALPIQASGPFPTALPPRSAIAAGAGDDVDALAGGISAAKEARPVVLETVAMQGCGFIREALDTGGKAYSNPLWNLTTLIATFAEDGRAKAHEMAKGHPAYDQADTEALFERKLKERETSNLGWPQCRSIELAGCKACATCPHLAAGKSPLNLGRTSPALTGAPDDDLPHGYLRDPQSKIVSKLASNPDGSPLLMPIADFGMSDAFRTESPHALHFKVRSRTGSESLVSLPLDLISDGKRLSAKMGAQGYPIPQSKNRAMSDFINSWVDKLRDRRETLARSQPFGWSFRNGKMEGFAYDGVLFTPSGEKRTAPVTDPTIGGNYDPQGDEAVWREASAMLTAQKRPAIEAIFSTAFAAPLMRFTGESGVVVSAFSRTSGIGKTTALEVAQAVWSSPKITRQAHGDTRNSVINKAATIRHLPMFWDELKGDEVINSFVDFAFEISGGKEKARLRADATQREVRSWQTMLLAASNVSFIEHILYKRSSAVEADFTRFFEFEMVRGDASSDQGPGVARLVASLEQNYGHAGRIYARFLGENGAFVSKEVAKLTDSLKEKWGGAGSNRERYWIAAIATMIAGAHFAKQLGLADFDTLALRNFLRETFDSLRARFGEFEGDMSKATNVRELFGQYRDSLISRHTLVTNSVPKGPGKPGKFDILSDVSRLDGIVMHIAKDDCIVRFPQAHFRAWVIARGQTWTDTKKAMEREFAMVEKMAMKLGAGTRFTQAPINLYEVKLDPAELDDTVASLAPAVP